MYGDDFWHALNGVLMIIGGLAVVGLVAIVGTVLGWV